MHWMVLHRPVKLAAFTTHLDLLAGCSQSIESRSQARRSRTTSRLLVTYLDRDMEFVWTPKHSDKMRWHWNSPVQIKPLQPINSFFSASPATIRIDRLDFQSGRRSRGDFRIAVIRGGVCYGRLHEPITLPKYRVSTFLNSATIKFFPLSPASP